MKIIIPIEVEIDHPHHSSDKWMGKCPTLNIGIDIEPWQRSSWYLDNPTEAIIALSNQIKNKITSEYLAIKIWEQFVKGSSDEQ